MPRAPRPRGRRSLRRVRSRQGARRWHPGPASPPGSSWHRAGPRRGRRAVQPGGIARYGLPSPARRCLHPGARGAQRRCPWRREGAGAPTGRGGGGRYPFGGETHRLVVRSPGVAPACDSAGDRPRDRLRLWQRGPRPRPRRRPRRRRNRACPPPTAYGGPRNRSRPARRSDGPGHDAREGVGSASISPRPCRAECAASPFACAGFRRPRAGRPPPRGRPGASCPPVEARTC